MHVAKGQTDRAGCDPIGGEHLVLSEQQVKAVPEFGASGEVEGLRHATYVIASTPRSGSSLLAAGLVATGVAGRPEEYFTPDHIGAYKEDLKLPLDCSWAEYLAKVMAFAATENGVRGVKIHWRHVVSLARALDFRDDPGVALEMLFPAAVFVNVVRADRRAQAISLFRAETTGEWFRSPASSRSVRPWGLYLARPTPGRAAVDLTGVAPTYEQIVEIERSLDAEQAAWTNYFTTRRREVLTVRYEELDANYRGEIARVLQFLGADPAHAAGLSIPPLERQSDHINEHWRRLIDQEHRDKSPPK
jgi:trehalose 2-sulfotransferase